MLGGTSDDARLNLMAWSCINSCIYLLPAIPRVYLAESNFRFRCYRTPGLELLAARALVNRAWQLRRLPLSICERQAALGAYREQLDRQRGADLAALLE